MNDSALELPLIVLYPSGMHKDSEYFPEPLLKKIAKEFGTPTYIYDLRAIEKQYRILSQALSPVPHIICFAVKANSSLSILEACTRYGSGFDIVSGGELHRVLKAGGSPGKTVFAGVGKTDDEIRFALATGILFFNIESVQEVSVIEALAKEMKTVAPISLRINPNISVDTHKYLATGIKESKFGIPTQEIPALWEQIKKSKHLKLVCIDCHIGSNISQIEPFETACTEVIAVADSLRAKGAPISHVDFGGGLGVGYSGKYNPLDVAAYGSVVTRALHHTPYTAVIEPGKYLIAEAGILLTKVLFTKQNEGKRFVIADAGMNDLMRPSLYQAFHKIDVLGKTDSTPKQIVDIAGPVCESGCVFAYDREIPQTERGDLLIIRDAGAYGFSMASNYNSRPRPAEVLIESESSCRLIRKREDFEDLVRHELLDRH